MKLLNTFYSINDSSYLFERFFLVKVNAIIKIVISENYKLQRRLLEVLFEIVGKDEVNLDGSDFEEEK